VWCRRVPPRRAREVPTTPSISARALTLPLLSFSQASSGPAKETNPLYEKRPKTFGEFDEGRGARGWRAAKRLPGPRARDERRRPPRLIRGGGRGAGYKEGCVPTRPPFLSPPSASQCTQPRARHAPGVDLEPLRQPPPLSRPASPFFSPFLRRRRRAPAQAGPPPLGEVAQVRAHPAPAPGPVPAPQGEWEESSRGEGRG